ncbi:hypothetical protein HanIR_Chr02g0083731 [Helianthus annuus]|nr:hypothetical protein HanIR_Chr02g0083731 [Helianthus annuus]
MKNNMFLNGGMNNKRNKLIWWLTVGCTEVVGCDIPVRKRRSSGLKSFRRRRREKVRFSGVRSEDGKAAPNLLFYRLISAGILFLSLSLFLLFCLDECFCIYIFELITQILFKFKSILQNLFIFLFFIFLLYFLINIKSIYFFIFIFLLNFLFNIKFTCYTSISFK